MFNYTTLTGHTLPQFPLTIEKRQDEIDQIYQEKFDDDQPPQQQQQPEPEPAPAPVSTEISIDDMLKQAQAHPWWAKFNKLWNGDWSEYAKTTENPKGERFADQHWGSVYYNHLQRRWYIWDKQRWKPDDCGQIMLLAKQTARSIDGDVAKINDDDKRKKARDCAHSCESQYRKKINDRLSSK